MSAYRVLLASSLLATALTLTACPSEKPPVEEPPVPGETLECEVDEDCPTEASFRCDQSIRTCVASCRTREDCSAEARGEKYALAECGGSRGCECDIYPDVGGVCAPSLCSVDADCGSLVCRSGQCVNPPDAALATSCRIVPDVVVTRVGESVRFFAMANDASGAPIVVQNVAWSSLNAVGAVLQAQGHSSTFNVVSTTNGSAPVEAIQAVIGSATCKAKAIVHPATPNAGLVSAVVVDELSGRPIAGARVVASDAAGAVIDDAETDAAGVAYLSATGNVTVTALHAGYTYVTFAGFTVPAEGQALYFPLRRNPVDRYGGFKGTFTGVPESPNIQAGIAAMSLAGSPVDFSFSQLLGRTVETDIAIANQSFNDIPLPAGTFLRFNNQTFKGDLAHGPLEGQGLASTCTDAFAGGSAEGLIANGGCGTRAAWALSANDVLFTELPVDALRNISNPNIGQALSQSLPLLKKFRHSLVRDVQFRLEPTPGADTGDHNFTETGFFTNQDLAFAQVPLGFSFALKVPDLPTFQNARMDSVIALSSVNVPGLGMIPMGLGAAVNENNDAKSDVQDVFDAPGLMRLRMAPAHSGVESTEYGVTLIATSLKAATGDSSVGLSTTGIYQRFPNNQLVFDGSGTSPVTIAGEFLPIPTGARFDFRVSNAGCTGTNVTGGGKLCRQFLFSGTPPYTADQIIRVTFSDAYQRRWIVYLPGDKATTGFRLPQLQGSWSMPDRTFAFNSTTGSRSTMVVQVLELKKGSTPVNFTQLAAFNSTNADQLVDLTSRFAILDYAKPSVSFVSPAPGDANPSVQKAGKITLQASYFKLGMSADGGVVLSFSGGTGACSDSAPVYAENGVKSGQVDVQLPGDCEGADVEVTATLVDVSGIALAPAVRSTLDIDLTP